LLLCDLSQTANGTANSDGGGCGEGVGSSSHDLSAGLAVPDPSTGALDRVLAAECTTVGGVLADLDLAHKLTQGGPISGSVLSGDSDLLGALAHFVSIFVKL